MRISHPSSGNPVTAAPKTKPPAYASMRAARAMIRHPVTYLGAGVIAEKSVRLTFVSAPSVFLFHALPEASVPSFVPS